MIAIRMAVAAVVAFAALPAKADDVLDAIDEARKAYEAGNIAEAKQSIDLASQLIAQKSAEHFAKLLPEALPGWTVDKTDSSSVGASFLGATVATRRYTNAKGDDVEVQITGDSALIAPIAAVFANPTFAGVMGKIARVGKERAIINKDGDVHMVIGGKFLVMVQGTGPADAKLAYAQAVDVEKLSKL